MYTMLDLMLEGLLHKEKKKNKSVHYFYSVDRLVMLVL